ncbi:CBS domain-containing protein [Streptomyces sp. NPDC059688]|uniref:CBS domain-containing protein n=2 Tax=Streptomyces TaxID=1883 RepID=A0ABV1U1Q6_9ACTN|nr:MULTISPECIES: CBS domain-containing protein [unclassified Streptomyces]OKJ84380.1 oxidoreductase [Streptomyces sp. CB01883]PKW11856.1 CBS domain protein [Streptomyces sp. 5112.2]ROP47337.1 CBS domain protein [Streptomyces sp. PanSC9]UXY39334.1 CBS domain-containing protein [Streptomyces sp. HUAS 14-6]SEB68353.1 CBS domain-containing protein [Streptomyces sp. 1222.5]
MTQAVREIMTCNPITVTPETPVCEVAVRMRDEDIGAVLVCAGDRLRGLVTDRDLTVRILADCGDVTGRTVAEACSSELVTVAPDDDVDRAVQLMRGKALRRLPVVEDGRVVGIVALGDVALEYDPESTLGHISAAVPTR